MIRWILGLLVAANIVLALWLNIGPGFQAEEQPQQMRKPDIGDIFLLDELPPKEELVVEKETPAVPDAADVEQPLAEPPSSTETETHSQTQTQTTEIKAEELPSAAEPEIIETEPVVAQVDELSETPVPSDIVPPPADSHCGEIGPFKKKPHARSYQKRYFNNLETRIAPRVEDEVAGYWVLIPALPDRQRANAMVKRLKNAGIEDIWLFKKGERKNSISLGLFSKMESAKEQQRSIQAKGFFPQISPLTKRFKRYWLSFDNAPQELLDKIQTEGLPTGVKIAKKSCKQASVAN